MLAHTIPHMLTAHNLAVVEFAKKTGDIRELSRTDLLVLALTYTLEVEANGSGHLRTEPVGIPLSMLDIIDEPDEKATEAAPASSLPTAPAVDAPPPPPSAAVAAEEAGSNAGDSAASEGGEDESGWVEVRHSKAVSTKPSKSSRRRRNRAARAAATADPDAAVAADAADSAFMTKVDREDDGEGEWFGPGSSSAATPFDAGVTVEGAPRSPVGCITTDFAMQVCELILLLLCDRFLRSMIRLRDILIFCVHGVVFDLFSCRMCCFKLG